MLLNVDGDIWYESGGFHEKYVVVGRKDRRGVGPQESAICR